MRDDSLTLLKGIYLSVKHERSPTPENCIESYISANLDDVGDEEINNKKIELDECLTELLEGKFIDVCPCGCKGLQLTAIGQKVVDTHVPQRIRESGFIDANQVISDLLKEMLLSAMKGEEDKEKTNEDPSSPASSTPKPRFNDPDPSEN